MHKYTYISLLTPHDEGDGAIVTFPDVDGVATEGDTYIDAMLNSHEALAIVLEHLIQLGLPLPEHRFKDGVSVTPSTIACLKLDLNNAFFESALSQAAIGRLMGEKQQTISRLLDVTHNSKFETIERMFYHLGKKISVEVLSDASSKN